METNGARMALQGGLVEPAEDQPLSTRKMTTIAHIANAAMIRWKMSLHRIDAMLAESRSHDILADVFQAIPNNGARRRTIG